MQRLASSEVSRYGNREVDQRANDRPYDKTASAPSIERPQDSNRDAGQSGCYGVGADDASYGESKQRSKPGHHVQSQHPSRERRRKRERPTEAPAEVPDESTRLTIEADVGMSH